MQTLQAALTLMPEADGLTADLTGDFSNAPHAVPAARGAPFGGLMAALAATAARQSLGLGAPLRTLTIQYLAAARFEPIRFQATLLRGGRNVAYAAVAGGQPDRPAIQALATFGLDGAGPSLPAAGPAPRGLDEIEPTPLHGQFGPWFTRHVEYRFEDGPRLFGQNAGGESRLRAWVRTTEGMPLDEARLLFLLDAVYPTYWTALPAPPFISASVDLRADLFDALTPETSPEGWVFLDFVTRDLGGGWAVEDGAAYAPGGRLIALVRQRRRLMPQRPA